MEAIVVGIKRTDFTNREGPVRQSRFYLNFNGRDIEGYETGSAFWDEIKKNKAAPNYQLGEIINVERDDKGKLYIAEPLVVSAGKKE